MNVPQGGCFPFLKTFFGESLQRIAGPVPFQPHFMPRFFLAHCLTFLGWAPPGPGVSWVIRKEQKGMSQKSPEIGMGKEESQMMIEAAWSTSLKVKTAGISNSKESPTVCATHLRDFAKVRLIELQIHNDF